MVGFGRGNEGTREQGNSPHLQGKNEPQSTQIIGYMLYATCSILHTIEYYSMTIHS